MPAGPVVILTQEPADNDRLAAALANGGISSHSYPCLSTRTRPYDGTAVLGDRQLEDFGIVALTSRRAAAGLLPVKARLTAAGPLIACVGEGTAREVAGRLGLACDIISSQQTGADLAATIMARVDPPVPVLYVRGDITTGTFTSALLESGWDVHELVVYENLAPPLEQLPLQSDMLAVFASPSAARRFFAVNTALLPSLPCVAIGTVTGRALRDLGAARVWEASRPDSSELAGTVVRVIAELEAQRGEE